MWPSGGSWFGSTIEVDHRGRQPKSSVALTLKWQSGLVILGYISYKYIHVSRICILRLCFTFSFCPAPPPIVEDSLAQFQWPVGKSVQVNKWATREKRCVPWEMMFGSCSLLTPLNQLIEAWGDLKHGYLSHQSSQPVFVCLFVGVFLWRMFLRLFVGVLGCFFTWSHSYRDLF